MKKFLTMFLVVVLCFSISIPVFAADDVKKDDSKFQVFKQDIVKKSKTKLEKLKNDKDFVINYGDDEGNYIIVPSKDVTNKEEYLAKLEEVKAQDDSYLAAGSTSGSYSDGTMTCGFDSAIYGDWSYTPVVGTDSLAYSGSSAATWSGKSPFNASSIQCSDTFNFSYVGLSLSVSSSSAGGTLSSNSSGCTITYPQINNNWRVDHHFTNITGYAYYISSTTEYSNATFTFGSSSYALQASKYTGTIH